MSIEDDFDDEVTDVFRKTYGKVVGYLVNTGTDRGLAEEIANDAFWAARQHWAHVRTLDKPEAYIFKIAIRERGKRQKAHEARAEHLDPDMPDQPGRDPGGGDPAGRLADRDALIQALQQLPLRLRAVIALRDVEDLSVETTAEILGISPGTVKSQTSEGRQRLRPYLAEFRRRQPGRSDR